MLFRRIVAALCALAVASSGFAQAQGFRPGFGFSRPGFQFLTSNAAALCNNGGQLNIDFVADTACTNGVNAANSTTGLAVSRASIGYDLAATTQFAANTVRRTGAGLLVEGAATNFVLNSQTLGGGTWTGFNTSASSDVATAPDGTTTADKLVENTASNVHSIDSSTFNYGGGSAGLSVFAKAAERKYLKVMLQDMTTIQNTKSAVFDVSAGTVVSSDSGVTASIAPTANGYFRVSLLGSVPGPNARYTMVMGADASMAAYAGVTGSGIILWGMDFKAGAALSSYVPTTTAAATRAADNISFNIPSGVSSLTYTFDDGSIQTVSVTPGTYTIPTNLNRPLITKIQSPATLCFGGSLTYYDFQANTGCSVGVNAASSTANLTTSRASIGYDLLATTQFAANVARRTGAGLLVEGASTNSIFPNKPPNTINAFASGTWGKDGTTGWTPNTTVAPDGTQTAGTAAFAASTNNSFGYLLPAQALSGATAWFFLKGPAGSQIYFDFDAAAAPYARTLWTFTGGWDRVAVANVTQSSSQKYVFLGTGDRVNGTTNLPAVNVAVAGLQVELSSPTPTSLIPTTTAAATRAADAITLTLPTGTAKVDLAYDNGTTNTVTTGAGTYTIPANPAGTNLKTLRAY